MIVQFGFQTLSYAVEHLERSSKRWDARMWLCRVLSFHPNPSPIVERFRKRLGRCGKQKEIFTHMGPLVIQAGCNDPYCPRCGWRLRYRETLRSWRKLQEKVGCVQHSALSFITINGVTKSLGEDFKEDSVSLKEKFKRELRRKLPGVIFTGHFHIAMTRNGEGKLHLHGWLYHEGYSRKHVREILESAFPDHNQVDVRPSRCRQNGVFKAFRRGLSYAADNSFMIRGFGDRSPGVLHDWIHSFLSMRSGGRKGIRVEYGLMTRKKGG